MREWALNYKNKSIYSFFFMINAMRIKVQILREYTLWTIYLNGSVSIYAVEYCHVAWIKKLKSHFLMIALIRDIYLLHNINIW